MTTLDVLNEYKAYLTILARRPNGREKDIEKAKIIIDALEKQTSKRANKTEYPWAQCPVCGGSISLESIIEYIQNEEQSHCEHCGQKIDWRNVE